MNLDERAYLECQTCGRELGPPLTEAQRRDVARDAVRYVTYCSQRCQDEDPTRLR